VETKARAPLDTESAQFLTFRIARHDFAIDASRVRGILPLSDLQPSASLPGLATCGLIFFRGAKIPITDLRGLLNLPHATRGRNACIIVVELSAAEGPGFPESRFAGFLADRVSNIVRAPAIDLAYGKLHFGGRYRRVLDPDLLSL
jgi:chemotaxis signal transduction protein